MQKEKNLIQKTFEEAKVTWQYEQELQQKEKDLSQKRLHKMNDELANLQALLADVSQ